MAVDKNKKIYNAFRFLSDHSFFYFINNTVDKFKSQPFF